MRISKNKWWVPWAFLAIPLVLYGIWVIYPVIQTFSVSFTQWDGMSAKKTWVGFSNYSRLFGDSTFWKSLKNNFYWLIMFIAIPIPLGLGIAMLFDIKLPGGKIFKTLFYLSMTLSFVVIAQIWSWIFEPKNGALTMTFKALGFENLAQIQQMLLDALLFVAIPVVLSLVVGYWVNKHWDIRKPSRRWAVTFACMASLLVVAFLVSRFWHPQINASRFARRGFPWLSDPDFVTFSLIFAAIWRQIPYVMVLYLAGLKNVPPQLVEASIVDGANWGQRFWHVILPMLKPATVIAVTISIIDSLRAFDIVYAMTQGGPFNSSSVLANFMYIESFNNYQMGYGSSIAVIQFLITLGFIVAYLNNVIKSEG